MSKEKNDVIMLSFTILAPGAVLYFSFRYFRIRARTFMNTRHLLYLLLVVHFICKLLWYIFALHEINFNINNINSLHLFMLADNRYRL